MANKSNIVLIGMPGSGKTTIGKILESKLGYHFVDIDNMIEKRFGAIAKLFEQGEDYFRKCETMCAMEASKLQNSVIATGGGIITRKENMEAISETGMIFFLNRSVENILKDIVSETRPLLAGGQEKLYELYNKRIKLYLEYADVEIDSNKEIDEVISDILNKIKEK